MSDLLPSNYRDLLTYHAALRQFLNTSTAPAKPNPARAAKARDKLFKLSPSQFFELSTDVYDELQRRIDEVSSEPDFLLPKSSFHPKRNEARQKLGLLQQTRFRDLVSDILYEIERRDYHTSNEAPIEEPKSNPKGLGINSKDNVVTVQQSTIIPTKADLAWSSDEEEDTSRTQQKEAVLAVSNDHIRKNSDVKSINLSSHNKTASTNSFSSVVSPKNAKDYVGELNNAIKNKHSSNSGVNRGLSVSKGRNKDKEIELLLEEGTKMDKAITDLEQKNSLLQSKSEKFEQESQNLLKINGSLKDQVFNLEREIEVKNDQIKKLYNQIEIESNSRSLRNTNPNNVDVENLRKEVENLKLKLTTYETGNIESVLSLNSISNDEEIFHKLLSRNGLVPLSLLSSFRKLIHDFLTQLSLNIKNKSINSNDTFDLISKISKVSTNIANCATNTEKAELVRASISHAITATRYYTIYGEALPSLVIESALSEVVFTVYDFIQDVKLNNSETDGNLSVVEADITQANRSFNSQKFNTEQSIDQNNNREIDDQDESHVSPVKPLRMTKRGLNSLKPNESPISSPSNPLNLSISSDIANKSKGLETTKILTPKSTGLASLVSRYSPDPNRKINEDNINSNISTSSPLNDKAPTLRKSSSNNILSKVRQFEQQSENGSKTPSPSGKKVISPLQDSIVSQFGGKRRSSLESLEKPIELPKSKELNNLTNGIKKQESLNQVIQQKKTKAFTNNLDESDPSINDSYEDPLNNLDLASLKKAIAKDTENREIKTENKEVKVEDKEEAKEKKEKDKETTIPKALEEKPVKLVQPELKKDEPESESESEEEDEESEEEGESTEEEFDIEEFDIDNPDNTLSELLLYLEHQTVKVIATIQTLLTSIKAADSTNGELRKGSRAINDVVSQMVEATSVSMNQSRNAQLKEHGSWVVDTLSNAGRRMKDLTQNEQNKVEDEDYADKQFKQRLAGIAFDVAKCTKELVKTVEEANLKEEIEHLNKKLTK